MDTVDIHMPELHVETPVRENGKKSAFLRGISPKLF